MAHQIIAIFPIRQVGPYAPIHPFTPSPHPRVPALILFFPSAFVPSAFSLILFLLPCALSLKRNVYYFP